MNPRYSSANKIYYREREAAIYDLEYGWKKDDIEFWVALAREFGSPSLEVACGTLRILLPVAEAGITVTGIDISPYMLTIARDKLAHACAETQARVTLLEADARTMSLDQKFKLIYLPFNTFLVLTTVADQLALFDRVRAHLAPGGVFAFDIFVPDPARLKSDLAWVSEIDQVHPETGLRLQRDHVREIDPLEQTMTVHFRMREYKDDELAREWLSDLDLTFLYPRELEHLIARAGFDIVHCWGEYDRSDFWTINNPTKQILVVRPS